MSDYQPIAVELMTLELNTLMNKIFERNSCVMVDNIKLFCKGYRGNILEVP
jgi:hypothetical protein